VIVAVPPFWTSLRGIDANSWVLLDPFHWTTESVSKEEPVRVRMKPESMGGVVGLKEESVGTGFTSWIVAALEVPPLLLFTTVMLSVAGVFMRSISAWVPVLP
jgi:hypothetical protein